MLQLPRSESYDEHLLFEGAMRALQKEASRLNLQHPSSWKVKLTVRPHPCSIHWRTRNIQAEEDDLPRPPASTHMGTTQLSCTGPTSILLQSAVAQVASDSTTCPGRLLFDTGSQRSFITERCRTSCDSRDRGRKSWMWPCSVPGRARDTNMTSRRLW